MSAGYAVYVASNRRGLALGGTRWHIVRASNTHGAVTLCGLGWPKQYYYRTGDPEDGPVCRTCGRIAALREQP